MLRVVCLLSLFSVGLAQDCGWVEKLDCSRYTEEIECGSDGIDYANRCLFAKARCVNTDLHLQGSGTCASLNYAPSTSGSTAAPLFEGHNVVQDFFCLEMMHDQCPSQGHAVCASDGVTYANFCEFEKQKCSHKGLTMTKQGAC